MRGLACSWTPETLVVWKNENENLSAISNNQQLKTDLDAIMSVEIIHSKLHELYKHRDISSACLNKTGQVKNMIKYTKKH